MTDPDRTLAQGSVIQAVLQNAVSTEMPGNVVAVVSEPVPAFSGDAVLVPRGSRLFGSYRAGMQAGQRRVLIRWQRILTPDGASMEISSVGGDGLGRSGLSGFVDNRLRERLGTAALISVITAAPSLAASGGGEGTDLVRGHRRRRDRRGQLGAREPARHPAHHPRPARSGRHRHRRPRRGRAVMTDGPRGERAP